MFVVVIEVWAVLVCWGRILYLVCRFDCICVVILLLCGLSDGNLVFVIWGCFVGSRSL